MKKINLFLAGLTVFAFVACGNGETADADANVEVETEVEAPAMDETPATEETPAMDETVEMVDSMATEVTEDLMEESHEGHDHAEGEAH